MRRSKLQVYLEVLDALVFHGPMRLTRITYKANVNCSLLKPILKDLIKNDLVEKRRLKKNVVIYAATKAARATLLRFNELDRILPVIGLRTERAVNYELNTCCG
jgi:predicted transcriptional regulator